MHQDCLIGEEGARTRGAMETCKGAQNTSADAQMEGATAIGGVSQDQEASMGRTSAQSKRQQANPKEDSRVLQERGFLGRAVAKRS